MEYQLWLSILAVLNSLRKGHKGKHFSFRDEDIVKVYYWSVIHDRPVYWACQPKNWPLHLRRQPLPSPPTMSRRLRHPSVCALLRALEEKVVAPTFPSLFWIIDGKPLPISGCSKDRQAGYGRAANCKAKGYKFHALVNSRGRVAAWRVAPMNKDERVMAGRMLRTVFIQGYVVGDANYDSNKLHEICTNHDQLQLVTPRRYGPGNSTGHRKQNPGRLRSIELTENPFPKFANQLFHDRAEIERYFARLTNWGGGLTCLPPWVRTHRRVHRWVQAKLVLTTLKVSIKTRTYAPG